MAGISAPGLGSGLDINGIISKLMAVESQPLANLDKKEANFQAEISGYGSLKGALSTFQSALADLRKAETFSATTGSSSDESVLKVSTDSGVVPASYDVTVNRLAQRHKYGSAEFASTQTFGGGAGDSLTLTSGSASFTVDLSSAMTLEEIQAAINVDANETGITAGLITGDNGNQTLVLTAGDSGYANRVQLSYGGALDATTFNFSTFNRDASGNPLGSETELDASLVVDGVTVTRSSNHIGDAIKGVTLDLAAPGSATVSVDEDPGVAVKAVKAFVDAYNTLKGSLDELAKGSLNGDGIVRRVESGLRSVFNRNFSSLGSYRYLAELGITSDKDTGKLQLDQSRLEAALQENPDSVSSFFSDSDKGFAKGVDTLLDGFLGSDGMIQGAIDGVNSSIKRIGDQREALQRRLDMIEKRYRAQFTALDTLVAQMNTTSSYLGRQLDALASMTNGKK